MGTIRVFTIGFAKKSAETFFGTLRAAGVKRVIDIRLNNASQLAGFTKKDDLAFFLKELCACEYEHRPGWAPTKEILDDYKKRKTDWGGYERRFRTLITERAIEKDFDVGRMDGACLLCSEPSADRCHRRLVAEHLQSKVEGLVVTHL